MFGNERSSKQQQQSQSCKKLYVRESAFFNHPTFSCRQLATFQLFLHPKFMQCKILPHNFLVSIKYLQIKLEQFLLKICILLGRISRELSLLLFHILHIKEFEAKEMPNVQKLGCMEERVHSSIINLFHEDKWQHFQFSSTPKSFHQPKVDEV